MRALGPLLLLVTVGCSQVDPAPRVTSVPGEAGPTELEVAEPLPPALPQVPRALPGESLRKTIPALDRDPPLLPQLAKLRAHFQADGGTLRGPFLLQRVQRAGGGEGVLVSRADESDPFVLGLDRDQLVFSRERPMAGIIKPVQHVTVAPGPERGIVAFAYVPTVRLVAARMWADDGNPYANVPVLESSACDALAVAYWPGEGWLVACSSRDGTRMQLLRENLTSAWGDAGLALGTAGAVASARIAIDSPTEWSLVQRLRVPGGDRTLTYHYDADGQSVRVAQPR